jgi:hypothetical protein
MLQEEIFRRGAVFFLLRVLGEQVSTSSTGERTRPATGRGKGEYTPGLAKSPAMT